MKKFGFLAILLCILILLSACAGGITAEEAIDIAAEHLRAEYEDVKFRPEEAECVYREFEDLCCYFVDIPYTSQHHCYRVSVNADTGEVIDVAMCK